MKINGTIAQRQEAGGAKRRKSRILWMFIPLLLAGFWLLSAALEVDIPFLCQTATLDHGWNLILVNDDYHIPPDYEVELVTLRNGQQVDRRIYPHLQEMFDDMRSQGVYPIVASGYRTEAKQKQLLEERIAKYEDMGYSWWSARKEALNWVSIPGTSEHQLGIAVDINQEGTRSTAREVYSWLEENAFRYGFICRYPEEKEEITGVSNEPWHYRYVGIEAAKEIREQGLCLEEYILELGSLP